MTLGILFPISTVQAQDDNNPFNDPVEIPVPDFDFSGPPPTQEELEELFEQALQEQREQQLEKIQKEVRENQLALIIIVVLLCVIIIMNFWLWWKVLGPFIKKNNN